MFFCEKCGGIFSSNRDLKLHTMTVHMKYDEISFPQPSKMLKKDISLKKKVPQRKSHLCTICDRSFSRIGILRYHLTTHIEKEYECSACGKILKSRMGYNNHVRKLHKDLPLELRSKDINLFMLHRSFISYSSFLFTDNPIPCKI